MLQPRLSTGHVQSNELNRWSKRSHIHTFSCLGNCTKTNPWYAVRIPWMKYIWVLGRSWGAGTTNLVQNCFMLALSPGWNLQIPSLTDPSPSPAILVSKHYESSTWYLLVTPRDLRFWGSPSLTLLVPNSFRKPNFIAGLLTSETTKNVSFN